MAAAVVRVELTEAIILLDTVATVVRVELFTAAITCLNMAAAVVRVELTEAIILLEYGCYCCQSRTTYCSHYMFKYGCCSQSIIAF
jgi:hypothetical protein